jgi:thiamine biosynthesis lipoprotein
VTSAAAPAERELRLAALGTELRLLVGIPAAAGGPRPADALEAVRSELTRFHARLSRFLPDSELSRLNRDPSEVVPATPLLRRAVTEALLAAERSEGLVDPTLVAELERSGYATSRAGVAAAPLGAALAEAPDRRAAASRPGAAWRRVEVLPDAIRRPPGLRLDLGGTGKGLAADLCAPRLAGFSSFALDLGGDMVVGGSAGLPRMVHVAHPLRAEPAAGFSVAAGAIATSGLTTRLWRTPTGFAHHLLDPATGAPAWTGVIQATALARTGVEAETLAKTALLSGPEAGLALLHEQGGALVLDDGSVEVAAR